jgi:hypothetical protein
MIMENHCFKRPRLVRICPFAVHAPDFVSQILLAAVSRIMAGLEGSLMGMRCGLTM